MNTPFAAALIAGGRSQRFGSDKAFFKIDGTPLWQHQLAKIEALMPSEIIISANADQHFDTVHRVVVDSEPDRGPLGALASCLQATKIGRLLVLAVDLPDMPLNFLGELAYVGSGVIPQNSNGTFEPLVAVYPAELLPLAQTRLDANQLALQSLNRQAIAEGLLVPRPIADHETDFFRNLNRPHAD